MARNLNPSPRCVALVREFEGLRLRSYPDPGTGGDPWTIGYGHTGPEVRPGMNISHAQAEQFLVADLKEHARQVRRLIDQGQTSQRQFDAMLSFHFNTGKLHSSTLLKRHNAGLHDEARREFHRWIYASNRKMPGLVRRRAAEAALYGSE